MSEFELAPNGCARMCSRRFTLPDPAHQAQFAGALIDTGDKDENGWTIFDCRHHDAATGDCFVHGTPAKPQVCIDYGMHCREPGCEYAARQREANR